MRDENLQELSEEIPAKKEKQKRERKNKNGKKSLFCLHGLQHLSFVCAAVAFTIVLTGAFVVVDGRKGTETYRLENEDQNTAYEDSRIFNKLLGNSVTDIICFGAIRAQMETDGVFDPKKEIDVTAFAGRYNGLPREYITAKYYLEDLIKWQQSGFDYEDVYMTGDEADKFLSRSRTVTTINVKDGGNVSYLNSDLNRLTTVVSVSGNMIGNEDSPIRDDVTATVMDNRYHTVDGKNIEEYVSSWDEYYELCENVRKSAEDLSINYEEYLSYKDYYSSNNSNIAYYIRKTVGKNTEVFSNKAVKNKDLQSLEKQLREECGAYIIYDPKNMKYDTNTLIEEETVRYVLKGYEYAYPEDTQILIGVKSPYAVADVFTQARRGFEQYSPYFWQYLAVAVAGILLYVLLAFVLTLREGKERTTGEGEKIITLKVEDKIPTEIMLLLTAGAVTITTFAVATLLKLKGLKKIVAAGTVMPMIVVIAGMTALFISFLISFFYYSYVRRIKAGTLWKNSLLRRLCKKAVRLSMYLYDNSSVVLRALVPALFLFFLNMLLWIFAADNVSRKLFTVVLIIALFADGLAIACFYKAAIDRQRILKGIKKINAGDMEHKIDVTSLHGDNLILAGEVNSIGDGIRDAVATSMKDERLKADLITNVSHDIKTPLTSIINYVDLIKRENIDNPKVKEYIEVLDTKSQRLKQLTDDLVEASKISSGNIVLQMERINLIELLNQTIGEFSEKFEQKNLTPVIRTKKSSVYVEADSRRIWRVIENLFNNIFKYALAGTRVYIDVEELKSEKGIGQVALSVKNISANPIKVSSDELTERFIRGDESRTTEGSGLGLSIAKNLTEAMNGKFEIMVDGDLFKVVLTFPLLEDK